MIIKLLFIIIITLVLLIILNYLFKKVEPFENLLFNENEIKEITEKINNVLNDLMINYNSIITDSEINEIITIYKDSQKQEIKNRYKYFEENISKFKDKFPAINEVYWNLRMSNITDNDNDLKNIILKNVLAIHISNKFTAENPFNEEIKKKLKYKIPKEFILFLVNKYDINNKNIIVDINEINNKIKSNPLFLE